MPSDYRLVGRLRTIDMEGADTYSESLHTFSFTACRCALDNGEWVDHTSAKRGLSARLQSALHSTSVIFVTLKMADAWIVLNSDSNSAGDLHHT